MTNIEYNNYTNVFSGLGPTPVVSKEVSYIQYNSRWGVIDEITLNGRITGSCLNYDQFNDAREQLLQRFNKDFIPFIIKDENGEIYRCDCAAVQKISFGESKWVGTVPYSISLRCYPEGSFSGVYGVLNPNESVSFSENENKVTEISHTVSAKGFNTNDSLNAIDNARQFVAARTGWRASLSPFFIRHSGINPVLISVKENIDRLNGNYAIEETYSMDQISNGAGILRYSIEHNSGEQGPATVTINGDLIGGLNNNLFSAIRSRFTSVNFYNIASDSYGKQYNLPASGLNSTPINKVITENLLNNTISFDYAYDNDPTSVVFAEYTISFEEDQTTFNVVASIQGTVRGRGEMTTRWNNVKNHYDNQIKNNLYDLVLDYYRLEGFRYTLNPDIISKSESYREFEGIINFSASFGTAPIPPNKFEYLRYTISVQPSINMYGSSPLLRKSEYYIQNFRSARREVLVIQGEAKIENSINVNDGIDTLRSQINLLIQRYSLNKDRTIDSQNIVLDTSNMSRVVPFQVQVSYDGSDFSV
jgi:hypothetical protein